MKKQVKGLIALGTVTAVLGGGLAILKLTDKSDDDTSSSSSQVQEDTLTGAGLVLVEDSDIAPGTHTLEQGHTHGAVESVKIKNASGEFEAVVKTPATEEASAVYTIKGYEDLPLNDSNVGYITSNIDNLTSAEIIEENCSDMNKFGLGDTALTAEVKYQSGRSHTLYIGDVSPVSKRIYVKVDNDTNVYTVYSGYISNLLKAPEEFIDLTLVEEPEENSSVKVEAVSIKRQDLEDEIYLEYDPMSDVTNSGGSSAKHVLAKPISTYISADRSPAITNGLFGLKAEAVKCAHFTDKDMEEAGLKEPFCTVVTKCEDGKEYTLYLSKPFKDENGKEMVYAVLDDIKVIFTLKAEDAKWVDITLDELISRTMFSAFVWNISELTASTGDITEKFTISMKDSSKKTVDAKTADADVKRNGEGFDAERFRLFNAFLIELHAENLALDEEVPKDKDKLMATVVVTDSFRETTTTYEFYDYSVMKSLVVINGESMYYCSKKNAESLVANIKKIETGETFNDIS